jgi:hypothetical protein
MNWKQHLFLGTLLSIFFVGVMMYFVGWYGFAPFLIAQMIMIIIISPLVPDLDIANSKLQQGIMATGFVIALVGIIYWFLEFQFGLHLGNEWLRMIIVGILISGITFFNTFWSNHRGLWHSIPMAIIYGAVVTIIVGLNIQLGVLATFGFWSHLLGDKVPFKIK